MLKQDVDTATALHGPPCKDLQGLLGDLRARVAARYSDAELDGLLWAVSDAADRIICEHNGMAEELLGVYEQLGVVFEVTRRLSVVHRESEMVGLFVESLRDKRFRALPLQCVKPGLRLFQRKRRPLQRGHILQPFTQCIHC